MDPRSTPRTSAGPLRQSIPFDSFLIAKPQCKFLFDQQQQTTLRTRARPFLIAAYSKATPFSFGARFRQSSIALYSRTRKPSGSNRCLALSVTPLNGKQRLAAFAESIDPLLRHPHTIRYTKNNAAGSSGPAAETISKRRDDSQRFPRHQVTLSSPSATNTHDCIYDCINKSPSGSLGSRWASRWHCGQRK